MSNTSPIALDADLLLSPPIHACSSRDDLGSLVAELLEEEHLPVTNAEVSDYVRFNVALSRGSTLLTRRHRFARA